MPPPPLTHESPVLVGAVWMLTLPSSRPNAQACSVTLAASTLRAARTVRLDRFSGVHLFEGCREVVAPQADVPAHVNRRAVLANGSQCCPAVLALVARAAVEHEVALWGCASHAGRCLLVVREPPAQFLLHRSGSP